MTDEISFGRVAEERKHGFRPIPPNNLTPKRSQPEREFDGARDAGKQLASERKVTRKPLRDEEEVKYQRPDGKAVPANQTVKIERAADDLKDKRVGEAIVQEFNDREMLARQVDDMRVKAGVPTDPTHRDQTQIDPNLFGNPESHQAPQIDPSHLPENLRPQHTPAGIDPQVHQLMQNKQVREHFEQEHGKVTQLQQHFEQQVQFANDFSVAAFRAAAPEFNGLRKDQFVAKLQEMQRTNPERFKQVSAMLDNVGNTGIARQQMAAQRAHADRQQFETYSREQDRAFERAIGDQTPAQRQAVATEMVTYAAEMGIDRNTLTNLLQTNPVMRHAAFQKMIHDAVQGRIARKQLAAHRQQNQAQLPPVQKPGTASNVGVRQVKNDALSRLNDKLNRTNSAKDAADLLIAMRKQRR